MHSPKPTEEKHMKIYDVWQDEFTKEKEIAELYQPNSGVMMLLYMAFALSGGAVGFLFGIGFAVGHWGLLC